MIDEGSKTDIGQLAENDSEDYHTETKFSLDKTFVEEV